MRWFGQDDGPVTLGTAVATERAIDGVTGTALLGFGLELALSER